MNKMNSELKEKMQKAANIGANNRFDKVHSAVSHAWHVATFMDGATSMYAELKEQIEWVSVEERLPEERTIVLVKTFCNKYYDGYLLDGRWVIDKQYFLGDITYWRKMEL